MPAKENLCKMTENMQLRCAQGAGFVQYYFRYIAVKIWRNMYEKIFSNNIRTNTCIVIMRMQYAINKCIFG